MKSLHILMIDDDVDFAESLRMTLTAWGHDVTVTYNWLSVMTKLRSESFDLILADVETPTGNGLTAFEFLNQEDRVQCTPKVFVTGRSDADTKRRCQEMNARYVHKSPRVFDELKGILVSLAGQCDLVTA